MFATKYQRFLWVFLEEGSGFYHRNIYIRPFRSNSLLGKYCLYWRLQLLLVSEVRSPRLEVGEPLPSYLSVHSPIACTGLSQKILALVTQKEVSTPSCAYQRGQFLDGHHILFPLELREQNAEQLSCMYLNNMPQRLRVATQEPAT